MTISKQKTAQFFRLSISITVFGALFKFISWPLILVGAAGMIVFHSIQFFQKDHKSPLDYSRLLLILIFACNYVFSILELPYVAVLTILTKTTLLAFLSLYIKELLAPNSKNEENNLSLLELGNEKLAFLLADMATVYIVVASLFKILNWEVGIINANVLLIIGLFSALISILAGTKSTLGK